MPLKKLMVTYPSDSDIALARIYNRLNTVEISTSRLNECYCQLREKVNYVATNSEPTHYFSNLKVAINGKTFDARCDIMYEFCLMPKDIHETLNLWGLSE